MKTSVERSRFTSHHLERVLPESDTLWMDHQLQVTLLSGPDGTPKEAQEFTDIEWLVWCELIAHHPQHCPHAALLSAFHGYSIEQAMKMVNDALDYGDNDALLRPVRNILSRVRIKTRAMGIEINSLIDTGYVLMPPRKRPM